MTDLSTGRVGCILVVQVHLYEVLDLARGFSILNDELVLRHKYTHRTEHRQRGFQVPVKVPLSSFSLASG